MNHRLDHLEKGQKELKTDVTDLKLGQDQLKDNFVNSLGPYFEQIEKHIDMTTSHS